MTQKKFSENIINLYNQKLLTITGVESVTTMNENQISLFACNQKICVTGLGMEVEKLDTENGTLKIKGTITGIIYNQKKESFFKRIFK